MPLITSRRLQQSAAIAVASVGLLFGALRAAHAFTFAPAYSLNGGSANLHGPGQQFQSGNKNNSIDLPGGATLHFRTGPAPGANSNEYNFNAIMDSLSAPGR